MCEEHCAEGSAAQVMLHGAAWQPGVKYRFKVDVERDGENEIYTAQMYKDNKWNLIAKALGPNYANKGLGYLYQFLETYERDYEYQRVGVYSEQFYQVEGNTTWIPVLSVSPFKNPNRNHLYYAYSAALTEEKNGIVLSLDGDGPGNADGTTYMKSLYYNSKNIHFPEQTPKKMSSSTTTSKPPKKTQAKQDTLRKFQITDATCYCNDVSTLSSPVYMDDFLVALQDQGYWWDRAAQQSNSEHEFLYNGTSAAGRDYTAVTKINTQKPFDGVQSISAMLYECFIESETVPGYNNELIPSECSVHTNYNEVIAETQFF
ncbi:hypothetical protein K7432_017932 [Basidiobolus ranarum]|uniref:Uncharacterized protein n=1 Tax=Basidiobolus ranarum TaxID=34480 RepID=A0ABR2WCS0_9FUNG